MDRLLSNRDLAILVSLYLSKFSREAVIGLGFKGFQEAYRVLGYSFGFKPATLKNYRDEFDPFFPNLRKGWHKRATREYCKIIFDKYSHLDFYAFTELIKKLMFRNYEVEEFVEVLEKKDKSESVAKRLITGIAAERYFKKNYNSIDNFSGFKLKDATNLACGFDFKLSRGANYYCVEVKGLNSVCGNITMTEKEYLVAKDLKDKYCLFIVTNFSRKPIHRFIFDPVNSILRFKEVKRRVIQINYTVSIM